MLLRSLEQEKVSPVHKLDLINSLKFEQHQYFSFFVCRNPVDKLVSVYNYMLYQSSLPGRTIYCDMVNTSLQTRSSKTFLEKIPRLGTSS